MNEIFEAFIKAEIEKGFTDLHRELHKPPKSGAELRAEADTELLLNLVRDIEQFEGRHTAESNLFRDELLRRNITAPESVPFTKSQRTSLTRHHKRACRRGLDAIKSRSKATANQSLRP